MLRKLHHKNIVQMIGVVIKEDKKLLVFEYMSGGSVSDWMAKVSPCSATVAHIIGMYTVVEL
jgi:serine/threonine protein kinase